MINEDFEKSETEIESYESTEKLKKPHEHDSDQPIVSILDDLNGKEITIIDFKRCLNNVGIITYLFS